MYLAMARTLAALHNVDVAQADLSDYGRPGNYFARQVSRWSRQWEQIRTRDDANIERLIRWLPDNIPPDETSGIVHGDYRIGNLMFHPTEPRVVAVLDWELSTLGHPLADLAHSAMAWVSSPESMGALRDLILMHCKFPRAKPMWQRMKGWRATARGFAPSTWPSPCSVGP